MATAAEASDVAMRYVTEAERCPPHQNIACGYCELLPWSLKQTCPPSTEKIKNARSFDFMALCDLITIMQHWWLWSLF
jgi:hypothetical protein